VREKEEPAGSQPDADLGAQGSAGERGLAEERRDRRLKGGSQKYILRTQQYNWIFGEESYLGRNNDLNLA